MVITAASIAASASARETDTRDIPKFVAEKDTKNNRNSAELTSGQELDNGHVNPH